MQQGVGPSPVQGPALGGGDDELSISQPATPMDETRDESLRAVNDVVSESLKGGSFANANWSRTELAPDSDVPAVITRRPVVRVHDLECDVIEPRLHPFRLIERHATVGSRYCSLKMEIGRHVAEMQGEEQELARCDLCRSSALGDELLGIDGNAGSRIIDLDSLRRA